MKPIQFAKSFEKSYKKRIQPKKKLRAAFEARYRLFVEGERGIPLNDHGLTGQLAGKRAFAITGDIRVIYVDEANCYRFLDIGTHAQVYDK